MAKKRGNNEGSIHKLPSGTWRAQVTLQGRRLSRTTKTQREAQQWVKQTLNQVEEGLTYAITKLTLEDFLTSWIISNRAAHRPTTSKRYEYWVRTYINPRLGKIKLKDLRPDHVQGLYNHLLAQGVGIWTVSKIHLVLHAALAQAFKTGLIVRNPAGQAIPPKTPQKEMQFFDEDQVSRLLLAARGTQWEALIHLAVSTGMRQMELLGLRWDDLDWVQQTIRVERQLVRTEDQSVEFAPLKTRYSRRTISLGTKVIEVLHRHYDRQHEASVTGAEKWVEHGLIFTTRYGGKIHYRNLLRDYKCLLHRAGLPEIRFHDLRHTAASLMLNHNIPAIVVSRRLGHANASITLNIYGHLIPDKQSEAAEMIDDLIVPVPIELKV